MKFGKSYEEYMQGRREKELPAVGLKELKQMLKRCSRECSDLCPEENPDGIGGGEGGKVVLPIATSKCSHCCPVCDGTFFPILLKEMSAVIDFFNKRAQELLGLHSKSFLKYLKWFRSKLQSNHGVLIQESHDLITYAIINSMAMRKILKKYDKIHNSKQGQAFRSRAQIMHIEILQSPWLCQLIAFYVNLRESTVNNKAIPGLSAECDCSLTFDDDKPISSGLSESMKLVIDLTCPICLDIVFDPVSLTCGHIFCYMCSCSSASVSIVDGLKTADPKARCPLCRQEGVYEGAVHLDELNILLRRSCPNYWEKRLQAERVERVQQAKKHWESQCRAFIGI